MIFISAKYAKDPLSGEIVSIIAATNTGFIIGIPLDPANTDYAQLMQLVAEGKLTIAPAE